MKKIIITILMLLIIPNITFAHILTVNDCSTDVAEGRRVTSIAGTKYTFLNWTATGITLTDVQQKNPRLEFRMPANNVTLVANYKETSVEKYTVSFNPNGGEGSMESVEFTENISKNLPANQFSKNQYKFIGWSTTLGGNLVYTDEQAFTATGNCTLFAVWEGDSTPVINVTKGETTTNSIVVNAEATDNIVGMPPQILYSYYYKLSTESTYKLVNGKENILDTTCKITNLTQGSMYDIKVTAKNNKGNVGEGYLTDTQTSTIIGKIVASELVWNNGKASTTLTTTDSLNIEYQIDSTTGNWISEGSKSVTVNNLENNQILYARLTDGNNAGQYITIKILDNIKPSAAKVSKLPANMVEGNNFNITVTHTDSQSGIDLNKCKWVFNQDASKQINISSYNTSFGSSNIISIKTPVAGTYYLHVLSVDKNDNKTETIFKFVACKGGKKVKCSRCGGDGRISSSSTCSSCGGDGGQYKPQGHYCSNCGGSGKVERRWVTCSRCGGKGKIYYSYHSAPSTCGNCGGAGGYYNGNGWCQTCGGSGWIKDPDKWVSCSSCGGKGTVTSSYSCSTCDGSGKILEKCAHGKAAKHYFWAK